MKTFLSLYHAINRYFRCVKSSIYLSERETCIYCSLLWKSLRYLSDGLRVCSMPSSIEWRLTSKSEWKSSLWTFCLQNDLPANRRVIADFGCVLTIRNKTRILSCCRPSRDELLSPSLKSYENSDSTSYTVTVRLQKNGRLLTKPVGFR